jgi:hypothetical protein
MTDNTDLPPSERQLLQERLTRYRGHLLVIADDRARAALRESIADIEARLAAGGHS